MTESPEVHRLRQQAKEATNEMRQARQSWGTSPERAREYRDAKQAQADAFKRVRAADPGAEMGGVNISEAIEAVERDVINIEAEIRRLDQE